ncbi:hypothetical protein BLOT_012093 [Blomia tropicalis]|nr:hypothetical protein BLOT_012093 [Blomia tropicalis]
MSSSEENVLLRRSTSSHQTESDDQIIQPITLNLNTTSERNQSTTRMTTMYHPNKDNEDGDNEESIRFGPITETLITTLSQDNLFMICFICVELMGIILVILATCWMAQIGGFGFSDTIIFNFHPVLMTLGMIFLNANGILIYRATRTVHYNNQKIIHFGIQTTMISISWIGFLAAYISHEQLNIPHFYSLHSWLGLSALCGVTISLVSSFLTYLYPKANTIYRRLSIPFHVFGGIANIALSAGICVSGITEKAIFSLNNKPSPEDRYPMLPSVAILLNMFGILLVIFTILVVWMVTKPEFKRKYKMTVNTPHYVLRREKNHD